MQQQIDLVVADRFHVQQRLLADAFGEVFRAVDNRDGATVHLRSLDSAWCVAPGSTTTVLSLARGGSAVRHPFLVSLLDVVVHKDRWYLVSEATEGETVAEHIARDGAVDEITAANLLADVADALTEVHAAGAYHGRVDPSRIVIDERGARLRDLGLGMLIGDESEEWRTTIRDLNDASVAFLSPEQVRCDGPPTAASDVWALAAVLHFLITGASPYAATTRAARASAVRSRTHPRTDKRIAALIEAAMHDDPARRPSMAAFAEGLRVRRSSRWPRFAVAAGALGACILGLGLSFVARPASAHRVELVTERSVEAFTIPRTLDPAPAPAPAPVPAPEAKPTPQPAKPLWKKPARDPFYGVTSPGF